MQHRGTASRAQEIIKPLQTDDLLTQPHLQRLLQFRAPRAVGCAVHWGTRECSGKENSLRNHGETFKQLKGYLLWTRYLRNFYAILENKKKKQKQRIHATGKLLLALAGEKNFDCSNHPKIKQAASGHWQFPLLIGSHSLEDHLLNVWLRRSV